MNGKRIIAIDLFCGAGGLTSGLRAEGIEVAAGIDLDPICQFAFEHNNPESRFLLKDVSTVTADELTKLWSGADIRLLAGCAPCQPFSTYSQGKDLTVDSRWRLLDQFARLAIETKPHFITMENVPSLRKSEVFTAFVESLKEAEYDVWFDKVDCSTIGLPQKRNRLVLIASRIGIAPRIKCAGRPKDNTVKKRIGDLPAINAGGEDTHDRLHRCATLSRKNLERIRASKPGGSWRDWPDSLRSPCHLKDSGDGYLAVYGRMEWDKPAPTMTTQCYNFGSGRFGHPKQDRAISLREAALLQGFPLNYQFEPKDIRYSSRDLSRLIGNAVPPPLGERIARVIKRAAAADAV
jgi:DNA (cytosine-5)-methyltransferase 1